MIPEYHDYRSKPPKKDLGSWPFWSSPPELAFDYIIKIVMFLILLPMFFGVAFTPAGLFLNYLLIDFIIYLQYKKIT